MKNNAIIFGDSYSTFEGYVPEGYAVYYSENERPQTDVRKVSETWWHQVITEAGLNLVLNNSYSGSTLCHTGWGGVDCSKKNSFIFRLRELIEQGFFEKNRIDKVFVFGTTNDSWANAPLGELKYEDFEENEFFSVLPAIGYFMKTLRSTLPEAEIYCLINTELKPEISEALEKASDKFNITKVNFENIDKSSGHPTIKGMQDIKNAVLKVLK